MNCGRQDGTIVAAHSNQHLHGKGAHCKAHDCFHAWLCFYCHTWLDQGRHLDPTKTWTGTRDAKVEMFRRSMDKTLVQLWEKGLVKVA